MTVSVYDSLIHKAGIYMYIYIYVFIYLFVLLCLLYETPYRAPLCQDDKPASILRLLDWIEVVMGGAWEVSTSEGEKHLSFLNSVGFWLLHVLPDIHCYFCCCI